MRNETRDILTKALRRRILVLDGAMGTMIQSRNLSESDFRGERFKAHPVDLAGNYDILCLTNPDVIADVHRQFLTAGADIISTNTFSGTAISQADYRTESFAYEINKAGAAIARKAVADFFSDTPRFVAGSMGPTNRSCSLSPDVENPGYRAVTFEQMSRAYKTQAEGLIDGGADLLLIETAFDTLNAKAALFAILTIGEERGIDIPIWVSGTIIDSSGRTLSGQTIEAFYNSIRHAGPFCVGLNCALGAKALRPFLSDLSEVADIPVAVHPNAGLPDELGAYNDDPEYMAGVIREFAESGLVNIVGGCCGTTAEHIRAIAVAIKDISPRAIPTKKPHCRLSGLEPLTIGSDSLFVNIGERTNVAGSSHFAKLIREEKYDAALKIAAGQVDNGAQVIDVNMDDAMLDAHQAIVTFLNLAASDPNISRVPVMVDSSRFSVIEAGLQCLQGKGIVNSISLKDGEAEFIRRARLIRKYGAAVIVMAFDENGQAVTYQHKVDICTRAYKILTEQAEFPPEDIIFDPNVLTVATGMEEHNDYAIAFIEACRTIKQALPLCKVSGGISNLSFAFRGNNTIREALHSVFLYYAVKAGLDMGIVNAGQLAIYEEIDPELRAIAEDVVLNRAPDATERLTEAAHRFSGAKKRISSEIKWRDLPLKARLSHALVNGLNDFIEVDITEALGVIRDPVAIIEGPLMDGMNEVGDLFGAGKMFLPQVIRSARVMKQAVAILQPHLNAARAGSPKAAGKILLATVKGDVHDIGKNITKIVMECNGYEVIDLGVMTPADKIMNTAVEEKVDIIGLSGLITPSLEEMSRVASEMQRREMTIPLLIGGATTSRLHTAVKIDPAYDGPVIHVPDASRSIAVLANLIGPSAKGYAAGFKSQYAAIRREREDRQDKESLISLEAARLNKFTFSWKEYRPPQPATPGIHIFEDYPIEDLEDCVDWTPLFAAFDLPGLFPRILDYDHLNGEPQKLYDDARRMLASIIENKTIQARAIIGLFPANAVEDDIEIYSDESRQTTSQTIHFLRQQKQKNAGKPNLCLTDYIAPKSIAVADYIGAFAVSAGFGVDAACEAYKQSQDDYSAILLRALADRLAEALSEKMHRKVRNDIWGYDANESSEVGIRPAPGYPACPDHTEKQYLFDLLRVTESIGLRLTENYVMDPLASVCGWYFSHPDSRYFAVGRIGEDQLADYARRKRLPEKEARQWLSPNLW